MAFFCLSQAHFPYEYRRISIKSLSFQCAPYAFMVIMFFIFATATLQTTRSYFSDSSRHLILRLVVFCSSAFYFKISLDTVFSNKISIFVGRIDCIATHNLCLNVSELCSKYFIDQPVAYVKSIKTKQCRNT